VKIVNGLVIMIVRPEGSERKIKVDTASCSD
jgi:hypothetical protein